MNHDHNTAWKRRTVFLPVGDMSGLSVDRTASLAAGAPVYQDLVAASELSGLAIAAAGDEINTLWKIPWDFDRDKPMWARIIFSHTAATTDNPDWVISVKAVSLGQALSDPASSADVTLTFAAKAVTAVANAIDATDWKKGDIQEALVAADYALLLCIECNGLGSASANELSLIGVELAYTVDAMTMAERETTRDDPDNT